MPIANSVPRVHMTILPYALVDFGGPYASQTLSFTWVDFNWHVPNLILFVFACHCVEYFRRLFLKF